MMSSANSSIRGPSTKDGSNNKLKIAHRTRSKYQIELSLAEIGSDLPDDILLAEELVTAKSPEHDYELTETTRAFCYGHLSSSNLVDSYSNTASTPGNASTPGIEDPQDNLWMEFLNSLQDQNKETTDKKSQTVACGGTNKLIDHDDDGLDDPDFTLCLDNHELDEPDYVDKWLHVPRREAILLVKDAIQFCDASGASVNRTNKVTKLAESIPVETVIPSETLQILTSNTNEFVPVFNDLQKIQLDEQLRNHVQLLAQTCLITHNVLDSRNIFSEAKGLLDVLSTLCHSNSDDTPGSEESNRLLSKDFEIINLAEARELVTNIDTLNISPVPFFDPKKGLPSKMIEKILSSRVFCNVSLLPNAKYKYVSTFKRSQFNDNEKILLIMGFDKFKHLPKDECCQCIKDCLLAHRSTSDIRKQLNSISNSEQRQKCLKELLNKQVQERSPNRVFDKNLHYMSPFEQSERNDVQLTSMYTIALERLRLSTILKEKGPSLPPVKKKQPEPKVYKYNGRALRPDPIEKKRNFANRICNLQVTSTSQQLSKEHNNNISNIENTFDEDPNYNPYSDSPNVTCLTSEVDSSSNDSLQIAEQAATMSQISPKISFHIDKMDDQSRPIALKRTREKSPNNVFSTPEKTFRPNDFSTNIKKTSTRNDPPEGLTQSSSVIHLTDTTNFQNFTEASSLLSRANSGVSITPSMHSFIINTSENQGTIKPHQQPNISKIPTSLGQIAFAMPQLNQLQQLQNLQQNQQMQHMQQIQVIPQQQQSLIIPAGFQGTIVFQPTIHMHSKNSYKDLSNYRKIIPKGTGTPNKAKPSNDPSKK